ncbi:hypothetical protein HEB29_005563 [Streptomyces fulvorobeus]|uniref:Uncharacterized protein n=1 Tax=Streptomyces fulvorobeus TaxID=284028 RepID=A0A7Y9HHJ2_9ACTN|nr:hypothetical protein [Streptomyces fulvorobeus]
MSIRRVRRNAPVPKKVRKRTVAACAAKSWRHPETKGVFRIEAGAFRDSQPFSDSRSVIRRESGNAHSSQGSAP